MNKNKQQVSDRFMESVKAYLDERAANDELFAAAYAKPTKNLTECCNYILGEVEKSGKMGFADDEIFSMAVHYYDEDSIKDVKPVQAQVVVNHTVELTDEEKAEARREAMRQEVESERRRLENIKKAKQEKQQKEPEKKYEELSLFG